MRIFWVFVLCLLVACGSRSQSLDQAKFIGVELGAESIIKDFRLTDHDGHVRGMKDFHGKVVVMFFGYTHCPDACPTTMEDLARAVKLLGSRQNEVQVLFVTLDPQRDTPQVLAKYVPSFNSSFLGLYGRESEIAAVAKEFKIFYQKQPSEGKAGYTIDHTAGMYVFDKKGQPRLYLNYGQKPKDIAQDIRQLL